MGLRHDLTRLVGLDHPATPWLMFFIFFFHLEAVSPASLLSLGHIVQDNESVLACHVWEGALSHLLGSFSWVMIARPRTGMWEPST